MEAPKGSDSISPALAEPGGVVAAASVPAGAGVSQRAGADLHVAEHPAAADVAWVADAHAGVVVAVGLRVDLALAGVAVPTWLEGVRAEQPGAVGLVVVVVAHALAGREVAGAVPGAVDGLVGVHVHGLDALSVLALEAEKARVALALTRVRVALPAS